MSNKRKRRQEKLRQNKAWQRLQRSKLRRATKPRRKPPSADRDVKPSTFAERLQVELHRAVRRASLPGKKADVVETIQGLGYFAATCACQAGFGEMEWRQAMAHYMREVRTALGMEVLTDSIVCGSGNGPPPSIIVPGR